MKRKDIYKFITYAVLIFLVLFGFYYFIFSHNNLIKTWDHSTYWLISLGQKEAILNSSILTTIKNIFYSINYDDYNLLASLCIQPFYLWTHGGFLAYGMSIFMAAFAPIYIIYVLLYRKVFAKDKNNFLYLLCFLIPFLLCPVLHVSVVDGYLDIVGLVPIALIFYLIYQYTFEKLDWKKILILAFCFLLTIILRRYYMFFTVSFFITLALVYTVKKFILKKKNEWFKQALHVGLVGVLFSAVILILFHPLVIRVIESDYSKIYSAYSNGGAIYQVIDIIKNLGIGTLIIYILSYAYTFVKHKQQREFFTILAVNLIITIILFTRVQSMGFHHYYLFLLNLLIPISIAFVNLMKDFVSNKNFKKAIIPFSFLLYFIINFAFALIPHNSVLNLFNKTSIVYQSGLRDQLYPVMEDIKTILQENDGPIYTISSSGTFNNETFANYYLPDTRLRGTIIPPANVDLRDGFSNRIYDCHYVLIVNPKQIHLAEKDQQVISILYDSIMKDSPIKDNYQLVKEWNVDKVNIQLYEKIIDYGLKEKEYLKEKFNESYSEYKELFEDRIMQ